MNCKISKKGQVISLPAQQEFDNTNHSSLIKSLNQMIIEIVMYKKCLTEHSGWW